LILWAVTLAVYWPAIHFDFINFDDQHYVSDNFHVRTGLRWENISWALQAGYASNWHPLTWMSHMADAQWFGVKPGFHHLTNVIFHALNAMLLFLLLQRLTSRTWCSAAVAGLFALHPLHVESVAWVAERKDVLSAFFFFLTLLGYAAYVIASQSKATAGSTSSRNRPAVWYLITLLLFACALMSKPMVVTLPFVLLLLDFWPLKRITFEKRDAAALRRLLIEKTPFLALAIVSSIITVVVQQKGGSVSTTEGLPLETRFANALLGYGFYLAKTFWPSNLCIFYPHPGFQSDLVSGTVLWKVGGAALLFSCAHNPQLTIRKSMPYLAMGWFWFWGCWFQLSDWCKWEAGMGRSLQLPAARWNFIICVWSAAGVLAGKRFFAIAAWLAVLIACGMVARRQLSYWRNDHTLFAHALKVAPSALAHYNVGLEFGKEGNREQAREHFRAL